MLFGMDADDVCDRASSRIVFFCGSGGTLSPPTGQLVHKVVDDGPRWSGLDCDDWGSVSL